MSRRPLSFLMTTTAALARAFAPSTASAQSASSREATASTSITGVNSFNIDLDRGGHFSWASGIVSETIARPFSPDLTVGMTLRYDYESWNFGSPVAFGGKAPWAIDDKWLLANPLTAGLGGGAGLELSYTLDDNWELADNGAYGSYHFRLNDTGPTPNGVGENRCIPLFARVTRKLGPKTRLDCSAGLGVDAVDNPNGDGVAQNDYDTAPAVGFTLAHRY